MNYYKVVVIMQRKHQPLPTKSKVTEEEPVSLAPVFWTMAVLISGAFLWFWGFHVQHQKRIVEESSLGRRVFAQYQCGQCHSLEGLDWAKGTMGPRLDNLAVTAQSRVDGLSSEAYLRQALMEPDNFVVPGFLNVMPSFKGRLSEEEFSALSKLLLDKGQKDD